VGIARYGHATIPMDDALVAVSLDFSGRPYIVWNLELASPKLGDMEADAFREFFFALAVNAKMNLHVNCAYGINSHHIIEAAFKATARALAQAAAITGDSLPSTKGLL